MRITKKSINNLVMGNPLSKSKPFIIVKQSVTLPFTDLTFKEWALITDPNETEGGYPLDQDTAEAILEANNMVLVHYESCGEIYEIPGAPFKARYNRA